MSETPKQNTRRVIFALWAVATVLIMVALTASYMGQIKKRQQLDDMQRRIDQLKAQVEALKSGK